MTKELNIINGGLAPKRAPHIAAEMAKAARERPREKIELPIAPIEEPKEPENPVFNLVIELYDDDDGVRYIPYKSKEIRDATYELLHDARCHNQVVDVVIKDARCSIRGKDIKTLCYKISEEVNE